MRVLLTFFALFTLLGCSQDELIQKFSSPEDQVFAKNQIDLLRAGSFDEIEKVLDPRIQTANIRDTLVQMAALIPKQEPISIKLVGAHSHSASNEKLINTTLEYHFGDKWLLANVAVRDTQGAKAIVGFNVRPMSQSLEDQNRFSLAGKSPVQYSVLIAAVMSALLTLYSFVICARTKFPKRKWLWMIFVLMGFGTLAVNWTTGEWAVTLLSVQLLGAAATAPLYGPWNIAVSLPLGAIIFLFFKKPRLAQEMKANRTAEYGASQKDTRSSL